MKFCFVSETGSGQSKGFTDEGAAGVHRNEDDVITWTAPVQEVEEALRSRGLNLDAEMAEFGGAADVIKEVAARHGWRDA